MNWGDEQPIGCIGSFCIFCTLKSLESPKVSRPLRALLHFLDGGGHCPSSWGSCTQGCVLKHVITCLKQCDAVRDTCAKVSPVAVLNDAIAREQTVRLSRDICD